MTIMGGIWVADRGRRTAIHDSTHIFIWLVVDIEDGV